MAANMKIRAYHGSQDSEISLTNDSLYLTNDRQLAINFANGYCFNFELQEGEEPTLYTIEFEMKNPKRLKNNDEYEQFMDIANADPLGLKEKGYDGCIYLNEDSEEECAPGCDYYMLIEACSQAKIIKSEDVRGLETR